MAEVTTQVVEDVEDKLVEIEAELVEFELTVMAVRKVVEVSISPDGVTEAPVATESTTHT